MTYEVIHEIFNSCSGNQMRDIFFDEKEFESIEDLEKFVRAKHDNKVGDMERTDLPDGGVIFDYIIGNVKQRHSFTPVG